MKAVNRTSGLVLAHRLHVARSLWARSRGLIGLREFPHGEGLLLRPCKGVHTFFMRFPIDVIFLDRKNLVLATVENLKPERLTRLFVASAGVLELPSGTVADSGTVPGDEIDIG